MKILFFLKLLFFAGILLLLYILFKNPAERIYKINVIKENEVQKIESNVLFEDFNGSLNEDYWNIVDRGDNYNNELQYYNPVNVNIKDNFLEIEAKKEVFKDHKYTSGLINTQGKFEFLYGKVIFRAKPAIGNGMLSAVWLLPANNDSFPEVDVIEALGTQKNQTWTGIHYLDSKSKKCSNFVNYPSNNDFSIYELDWEEKEIRFYVNNMLVYKSNVGIPNKKMYLIVNLSVGGIWPKNPDDSISSAKFILDYVIIAPRESNLI